MDVHTYNITLRNDGEEFDGLLYFFLQTPDDSEMKLLSRTSLALESNATDGVSFPFTPSAPGVYTYKVTTDEDGTNILADGDQEIGKALFLPTLLEYGNDGDNLNITFENNGDNTYNYPIIIQLYTASDGRLVEYIKQYNSPYKSSYFISPNSSKTLPFAVGALESGEYAARVWYDANFDASNPKLVKLIDLLFTIGSDGKAVVGIEEVTADKPATTDSKYYTIDGMLLSGKPAKKGIYIRNGKKVAM